MMHGEIVYLKQVLADRIFYLLLHCVQLILGELLFDESCLFVVALLKDYEMYMFQLTHIESVLIYL